MPQHHPLILHKAQAPFICQEEREASVYLISYIMDHSSIQPWHVFTLLVAFVTGSSAVLTIIIRSAGRFRKSVLDELKVTRISIKELLGDLANRNPEAMGRIVAAMDDKSVVDFVRGTGAGKS